MRGISHRIIGSAVGAATLLGVDTPLLPAMVCGVVMGAIGGTAPDWMEIPYGDGHRIITHRTLTHWVPLWLAALFWLLHSPPNMTWIYYPAIAFVSAGVSHLVMDWPNPRGIPFYWPTHRHSLGWWQSGKHEIKLILLCWGITAHLIWQRIHFTMD